MCILGCSLRMKFGYSLCHNPWFSGKCLLKDNYLLEGLIFHWTKVKKKTKNAKRVCNLGKQKKTQRNCDFSVFGVGGEWLTGGKIPSNFLIFSGKSIRKRFLVKLLPYPNRLLLANPEIKNLNVKKGTSPQFAIQIAIQFPLELWNPHRPDHSEQHIHL